MTTEGTDGMVAGSEEIDAAVDSVTTSLEGIQYELAFCSWYFSPGMLCCSYDFRYWKWM